MVASYEIKRNALSARWGVWSNEQGGNAPVENLLAEFKSQDEAEMFRDRISDGQAPEVALAEIKNRPAPEKSEGGLFGKFFKRGGAQRNESAVANAQTNNPVIQIQAVQKTQVESGELTAEVAQVPVEPQPQRQPSFRYQDIAPSRTVTAPKPAPTPESVAQPEMPGIPEEPVKPAQPEVFSSASPEQVTGGPIAEPAPEPVAETREPELPASSTAANPPQTPPQELHEFSPIPQTKPQSEPAREPVSERNGMVNWTFTPPPDVSAEEVQSGQAPGAPVQAARPAPQPASAHPVREQRTDVRELHGAHIPVDSARFEALMSESAGSEKISDKKYNSIASKEYTEVSKAYASGNSHGTLHDELLHLASVCMAWADAIEKRMASGSHTRAA